MAAIALSAGGENTLDVRVGAYTSALGQEMRKAVLLLGIIINY